MKVSADWFSLTSPWKLRLQTICNAGATNLKPNIHDDDDGEKSTDILDVVFHRKPVKPEDSDNHTIMYDVFFKATDRSTWKELNNLTDTKATLQVKPFRRYEIFVMSKAKDVHGIVSARILTEELHQKVSYGNL